MRAVCDGLAKHGVVDIGMGIDMNESDGSRLSLHAPHDGQDNRVVSAQRRRNGVRDAAENVLHQSTGVQYERRTDIE
jgi:hypothetical protein